MTLREVIDRVDDLKPNIYDESHKVRWVSELDARIYNDVILTHEGNPYTTEEPVEDEVEDLTGEEKIYLKLPYSVEEASETTLLAEFPHDELYVAYLETKIDEYNQETARYNNSSAKFNSLYSDYCAWYNRTHMPLERGKYAASNIYRNQRN